MKARLGLPLLLVALPFVVYANNYRHAYHLDDAYTVASNTSIRDLALVPRYFVDPGTYTSVREQADYRPILQTTYALNYAWSRYSTWSWHFVQVLLHALVTVGLYLFGRRVLFLAGDRSPELVAFVAAAVFAIHPAASGVVNYFNARSSLLTAAFLLPALVTYLQPIEDERYARPRWGTAGWLALGLFTKVEAVGALGALWAVELWQRGREIAGTGLLVAAHRSFDRRTLVRIAPSIAVVAIYFVVRMVVMAPFPFDESRQAPGVGPYEYFVTQLTAWWHYVGRYVAPVSLVADDQAYPVYRSLLDPRVMLGIGGWTLVATVLIANWKRAPHLLAIAIAALALLSPTSSVAPLAEMVNEHRPYLPMGILAFAIIIPAAHALRRFTDAPTRFLTLAGLATIIVSFSALTWQRNLVFRSDASYWKDVLDKAPSSRAHLNYGLAMLTAGNVDEALRHYRRTLELAPFWYYTHLNLGVAHHRLGASDSARHSFDKAVQYDRYSGHALTWRGEFFLAQGDFAAARADFLAASKVSLARERTSRGLALANAGLAGGDTLPRPSPATLAQQQSLMIEGVDSMRIGRDAAAEPLFRRVIALNPGHYAAHHQLAVSLDRQNRRREARPIWEKVLGMAVSYNDSSAIRTARARLRDRD